MAGTPRGFRLLSLSAFFAAFAALTTPVSAERVILPGAALGPIAPIVVIRSPAFSRQDFRPLDTPTLTSMFDGAARMRAPFGQSVIAGAPAFDPRSVPEPVFGAAKSAPSAARGKSGAALFAELHETSGRGQRPRAFEKAGDYLFSTADNVRVNGARGVRDAYSLVFVPGTGSDGGDYPERGDQNGDGRVDRGMNVEHIWPQSFFDQDSPMRADLHHLLPTFMHPNETRGHLPFGEVQGKGDYSNNGGAKRGQGVFEPPDATKGRVARAMLYFYTRYHDRAIYRGDFSRAFWDGKLEMLLRWNRAFPPDLDEQRRNDLVERFQGNRNPYVDDPGLADRIGAEVFRSDSRVFVSAKGRPRDSRPFENRRRHRHSRSRHRR